MSQELQEVARSFGCTLSTAELMLSSRPGTFLHAVYQLGPIRCWYARVGSARSWTLDQRPATHAEILAAWERRKAALRGAA